MARKTITPATGSGTHQAGIYVRISKDLAGTSLGVQRQETECRDLASKLGWDVIETYVDNDLSASSGKVRPAYERMLRDMGSGRVTAVLAWHTDRLTRRPQELEALIDVADRNDVPFATCRAGELDLSTSTGRLVARLLGAVARHEAELKGERQAAQLRQRVAAGLPTGGGTRPFGWLPGGMKVSLTEAAIVRDLAERAIAGESVIGLTNSLIVRKIPTVTGKPWHPNVVRKMLVNPRLAGLMTSKGKVVGEGQWEPILDVATSRRVQEVLTYRGPRRANTGRIALLPGIIWCGVCGYELVTFRQQRGHPPPGIRSYGCRTKYLAGRDGYQKSCGRVSVKAEHIEDHLAEEVLGRLAQPKVGRKLAEAAARVESVAVEGSTAADLSDAEERLQEASRDYADGLIGRAEFLTIRDRLAERIERLRAALGSPRLAVPYSDPEALAAWWDEAEISQRQALLRQVIERVEIGPHSGWRSVFDPTRVTITWR